jgi:hypothetical protein
LIQDIRKYNFLRKNLYDLKLLGNLHNRGLNGFNFRLDLKIVSNPIIATEQLMRFDWRFKNSHSDGINSRLFRPNQFFSSLSSEFKKDIPIFKGRNHSARYGYFDYLQRI